MLIDGIFFSHGGASDIPGRKVIQNRGIINDLGRLERNDMPLLTVASSRRDMPTKN